jgi:hypothetical protein
MEWRERRRERREKEEGRKGRKGRKEGRDTHCTGGPREKVGTPIFCSRKQSPRYTTENKNQRSSS